MPARQFPVMSDGETQQIDVRYVANLARIDLSDDECATFQDQLGAILGYIETLQNVDVGDIEPTAHAAQVYDHLRADSSRHGLSQKDVLRNAPASANGQIRVPKVVDS